MTLDDLLAELTDVPVLIRKEGCKAFRYDKAKYLPFEFIGTVVRSANHGNFDGVYGIVIDL